MSGVHSRVRRPLVIGHYGGCNTGDEAMLAGLLSAVTPELRQRAAVVVKDESFEPPFLDHEVKVVPAGLVPVLRALLNTDALVLGGGTHFHDDYTTLRYLRHFRYMLRYVGLSMLAKMLGRQVSWLGMGFGPFYRRPTQWLTRLGLKFCDHVSVRDAKSREEVAAWVPPEKIAVTFDLAALLIGNSHGCFLPSRPEGFRCSTLGVSLTSVRNSLTSGPWVDAAVRRRLASALNRTLAENRNLRLKVLVLRGGHREDDQAVSKKLFDFISRAHSGRVDFVPYHPDPEVTLEEIAACDAMVAARYHAGVLGYLTGCRLLFLAYHRKVCDLAKEIGLPDDACVRVSEALEEELLVNRLRRLVHGDQAFRASLPVPDATQRALGNLRAFEELS
ncbi:MAG: polysaccharide pyruvyl transferase family protein [Acidobacteriia bacterium]|nr:polysaccharide pyruvyl transferase family protein [Terriglobia bacterium]